MHMILTLHGCISPLNKLLVASTHFQSLKIKHTMSYFICTELFTDADGIAKFRVIPEPLDTANPQVHLSKVLPATGMQFRHSPVGFRSQFHCTQKPQWVFILSGVMQIGLQDGSSQLFKAGEHFLSSDTLPDGATFDPKLHGHWSAQAGDQPLVTLFIKQ
jgi:hypothetical protein